MIPVNVWIIDTLKVVRYLREYDCMLIEQTCNNNHPKANDFTWFNNVYVSSHKVVYRWYVHTYLVAS